MQRIIFALTFLLSGMTSFSLAAEQKFQVVTTTSDLRSITEFIGGDKVEVTSVTGGYQDPHFVDPKPSFMIKARKADLFIRIGLELETGWESLILEGARNPKIVIGKKGHLDASEGIERLDVPTQVIDRSMGDIHASGNPHYWLDPVNVKIVAENIARRLAELQPENAPDFQNNLRNFNERIDQKLKEWQAKLSPYKNENIIVYHKSLPYFAKRFGLKIVGQLEPKPGIPPTATHLKKIVEDGKEQGVKVIMMEVFYDKKAAEYVAQRIGAQVAVVPNSVGGTKEAKDYFSLMDTIVNRLAEALKEGHQDG